MRLVLRREPCHLLHVTAQTATHAIAIRLIGPAAGHGTGTPAPPSPATTTSAADAVAKVGDATLAFANSDPLQLALFDAEVLEQPPPVAEQDRDQVDLKFVEEPCGEGALHHDARPVDEHVLVAGSVLGISDCGIKVAHIVHGRPFGRPRGCRVAAEDVDGYAVVVVASPALGGVEGPTSGDHGTGGHELVDDLAVDASLSPNGFLRVVPNALEDPLVQPLAAVAETIVRAFVGSRDESVEGHCHGQHSQGHRSLPVEVLSS